MVELMPPSLNLIAACPAAELITVLGNDSDGDWIKQVCKAAGVGLDATIVNAVIPSLKAKTGKLAYWVAGLGQFFSTVENFTANVEGNARKCGFLLASRVRNYGGDLEIAKGASLLSDCQGAMPVSTNATAA